MKNKLIISIISAGIILASAAAGSFWYYKNHKKPAMDFSSQTAEQIRKYLDSNDFKNLDEKTRRQIGRQARMHMMQYTVDEYFKLPDNKKVAYLDKIISEMDARRQQRDANDPNRPPRTNRQFARSAADRRARMEGRDPLERAKMAAFRSAISQRRQQKHS